jgi:hypothetical protein
MDMQARLDPVRMTRLADDWQRAVDRIGDILAELDGHVAAVLERSWRGRGADASADALRRYVAGSLDGLSACRSAAVHLGELSTAAGDLRAAATPHDLADALVQVRQCYSLPAVAAGNAVEDIPAPPDPFRPAGHPSQTTLPSGVSQPAHPVGMAPLPSTPAGFPPQLNADAAPQSMPLPAVGADPSWRVPTHSAALPSSPVPVPLHTGPDPPPTPTVPPSGASPTTSSGPPLGGAARAAAPAMGMPFMGGMYPGHMARDGGGEHRTPRYLISAGNSNELIGELPLVAPPVIGE